MREKNRERMVPGNRQICRFIRSLPDAIADEGGELVPGKAAEPLTLLCLALLTDDSH
jgi:hypothetical protein